MNLQKDLNIYLYNYVYILKKGVNHADVTKDNVNEKCYLIGCQANTNNFITEFDFQRGVYFIPNKVRSNKKADYNWKRGNDGQDTDKAACVLLLGVALFMVLGLALVTFFLIGFRSYSSCSCQDSFYYSSNLIK